MTPTEHLDVAIIGAGLSGIGAAFHVQDKLGRAAYAILEGRDAMGGTWDLFRYPGVRSDSDMYTLGYPFRPWVGDKAITSGQSILNYIEDTARHYGIDRHIRYGHRVQRLSWDSEAALWTVEGTNDGAPFALTATHVLSCSGYYDYDGGYTPDYPGLDDFGGQVVHPQDWHEGIETAGKRVVVIGSGATAVTLVPALTETAAHVTMLQRSPTYVATRPAEDPWSKRANAWLPEKLAYGLMRAKNVAMSMMIYGASKKKPEAVRKYLTDGVAAALGDTVPTDPHFTPAYDPWDQRLCLVPDGDLFKVLKNGSASIVTDKIERFVPSGIELTSGQTLDADLVVSATGLKLLPMGGVDMIVDGAPVNLADTFIYKGMMLSGVPNFLLLIGYTNASWTLKSDLSARYFCRLAKAAKKRGADIFVPRMAGPKPDGDPAIDFAAGYVRRSIHLFPRQGPERPWRNHQNYVADAFDNGLARLDDGVMRFEQAKAPTQGRAA